MEFIAAFVHSLFRCPGVEAWASWLISEAIWPWLHLLLGLTILALALAVPRLWDLIKRVSGRSWVELFVIALLALAVRLWISPTCPQVYFDEICYGELADELRSGGQYLVHLEYPQRQHIMPFLPAWPFVLALLGQAIPVTPNSLAGMGLTIGCCVPPLGYLFAWLGSRRRSVALCLGLLLVFWPLHLRLSGCTALENGSLALFLVWGSCLWLWLESGSRRWLFLLICAGAWFANWRMENGIVVAPLFLVLVFCFYRETRPLLLNWRFFAAILVVLVLAWPGFLCDVYGIEHAFYLTDNTSVANSSHLWERMGANWAFWVVDEFHPLLLTALALLGCLLGARNRQTVLWLAFFLLLNVFYGFIPTADFSLLFTNDSWRNSAFPGLGLLVLAALGWAALWDGSEHLTRRWQVVLLAIIALGVVSQPWSKERYIASRHTWINEFDLVRCVGQRLPEQSYMFFAGDNKRGEGDSMYIRMWNRASMVQCLWYVLPESAFMYGEKSACPVLLSSSDSWLNDRKRVFLGFVGNDYEPFDYYRLRWLQDYYVLRLVAGQAEPYRRETFNIYEIDGLSERGRRWVEKARAQEKAK